MKHIIVVLIITFLLSSCLPKTVQSEINSEPTTTLNPETTRSPTYTQTPTTNLKPTQTPKHTETLMPSPTAAQENTQTPAPSETLSAREAEATIAARKEQFKVTITTFGIYCDLPQLGNGPHISPDGHWVAAGCEGTNRFDGSFLRVVSIQEGKNWTIYYDDYTKGFKWPFYNLRLFQWSKNGKYLYITAYDRGSGCCWMGAGLLLVRLNLENGQQTTIFNYANAGSDPPGVSFSISSSERYVLYIPQDGKNLLYVLDLLTWEQRAIELKYENTGAGETLMSNDDSKVILIIRQYPEVYQGDLTYGSLVLVDLKNKTQKKYLPRYDFEYTPKPFRWEDDDHVLLCRELQCDKKNFLLLNINTGELKDVTNP